MSLIRIDLNVADTQATVDANLRQTGAGRSRGYLLTQLGQYLDRLAQGVSNMNTGSRIVTGAVQATGLVTFTGAPVADEIVTIGNVVFTAKAAGATGNQFNIGGTVTITATNLAAAINASANLTDKITATSSAGVVTLTSVAPGLVGNCIQLSEGLTNATVTAFASGAEASVTTIPA